MKRTKEKGLKRYISIILSLLIVITFLPQELFAEAPSWGVINTSLGGGGKGPSVQYDNQVYLVSMVEQSEGAGGGNTFANPIVRKYIAKSNAAKEAFNNRWSCPYNKYQMQTSHSSIMQGGFETGSSKVEVFPEFPTVSAGNIEAVRQKVSQDKFLSNMLYKVFGYDSQEKRLDIIERYHQGDIAFVVEPVCMFDMSPIGVPYKYAMTATQMAYWNTYRLGDTGTTYTPYRSLISIMPYGFRKASMDAFFHKDVEQWSIHAWNKGNAEGNIARYYQQQPVYNNSEVANYLGVALIYDNNPYNPANMDCPQPNIKVSMDPPTLDTESSTVRIQINNAKAFIDPENTYKELSPEPYWLTAVDTSKQEHYSALNPKGRTNGALEDALDQSLPRVVQELVEPAKTTLVEQGRDTEDQIKEFTDNLYNRNPKTRSVKKLFMSWNDAETPTVDMPTNNQNIKHKIVVQSKQQYEGGSSEYLAVLFDESDLENGEEYSFQADTGTGTFMVDLISPYTGQPMTQEELVGMEELYVKFVTNYDRLEDTDLPAYDADYFQRKESDYADNVIALKVTLPGRNLQAKSLNAEYDYNTQEIKISGKGYVESLEAPMVTYQQLAFQVLDENGNPISTGSDQADLSRYSTGAKNADRFVIDRMPTNGEVKQGDTFDLGIPTSAGNYKTDLTIPYQMDTENIQVIAVHYRVNPDKLYPQGERTYDDNIITKYIIIDPNLNWQAQSVDIYSDQEDANGPTTFNLSVQTVGKLEKVPLGREDQSFQTVERVEYCLDSNGVWTTIAETTTDPMHLDDQTVHTYQLPPIHVDIGQQVVRVRYTLNPNHDQPTHESTFLDNVREESIILSVDPESHAQETNNATIACGIARDSSGHNVNGLAYIGKMLGGFHNTYDPWGERQVDYELYDSDHYCPGAPGVPPSGRTLQEGIEAIGDEFYYHLQYRYYILDSTDAKDPMNPDLVIKYDPMRGTAPSENEKTHVSVGEKYYDSQVISNPCHYWTTYTTHTREDGSTYTTSEDHDCGGYDWFIYKLKDKAEYKYYVGYNGDFSSSTIGTGHNASRVFAMEAQGLDTDYKLTAGTTIGAKIGVEIKTDSHAYEIPFKAMCSYSYNKGVNAWDSAPYRIVNMVEKEYADTAKTGDIQRRYFILPNYRGKPQAPTNLNYPESIMRNGKLAEGLTVTLVAQVDGEYSILDRSPGKNIKDLPDEYNPIYNVLGACYSRKLTVIDNRNNNYIVESADD